MELRTLEGAAWETELRVDSEDADPVWVTLTALAVAPNPRVGLDPADTICWSGCSRQAPLSLVNDGAGTLVVDALSLSGDDHLLLDLRTEQNGALPWTVAGWGEVELGLGFSPELSGTHTAWLELESSVPTDPLEVTAEAVSAGTQTERWEIPLTAPVDVLITLDRSESMSDFREPVLAGLTDLVDGLWARSELDPRLGVAVTDEGCMLGDLSYVDTSLSAQEALEALLVMADVDEELELAGHATTRGFTLAEAAWSVLNTGVGECNEGLRRNSSATHQIHISSVPEQSVNPYTYYVSLFQSMPDDPADMRIHAVAGDFPSGCDGASAGTGYYEATVATGGEFLSICDSAWGATLAAALEGPSWTRVRFVLSDLPAADSIEVHVNGVLSTHWTLQEPAGMVVFDTGYDPGPGSVVEISYEVRGDCNEPPTP